MKFRSEVVYRRFRSVRGGWNLVISKEYKKLMKVVEKALKENKQVIFNHEILQLNKWPANSGPVGVFQYKVSIDGTWYDKVTVEIND